MTGRVAWWSRLKGYGFLSPTDGTADVFCHHSSIATGRRGYKNLERDAVVEFQTAVRDGRTIAIDVRPVDPYVRREQSA